MNRLRTVLPALLFAGHLVLGLSLVSDYGISWDEPFERLNALVSARYVIEKFGGDGAHLTDYTLTGYYDRFHGVFFSLSVFGLERLLKLETYRDFFLLRHVCTFLLFWLGAVAFYFLARRRLGDWRWALLAWAFLLLSPRIFADSFYNPKDIPLLALYIFATYTLVLFLDKPSPVYAVLHALVCAAAISVRVVAVVVPALTLGFVLLDLINARFERRLLRQYAVKVAVFLPLLFGFMVAVWPYLWDQPLHRLAMTFQHMSKFTAWGGKVIFRGSLYFGPDIPWYYAPYWIFVTTPLLYTFLFCAGLAFTGKNVLRALAEKGRLYTGADGRTDLVLLALFLGPLLSVIVLHSVIYDGWRHLYFIYPSFLLLAAGGLQQWWRRLGRRGTADACCDRRTLTLAVGVSLLLSAWFIVRYHPHQNVYFNPLTLHNKLGQLDLDYWGLSYKQGFEALARLDGRDTLRVSVQNDPGRFNYEFLPDSLRRRFVLVDNPAEADYYISVYRHWEEGLQAVREGLFPYNGEEVHAIYAGESRVLGVYRMR